MKIAIKNWIARAIKIALLGAIAVAVFGFVVMSLWNWLMPALFGWHLISFWQALGLVVLSKILFGGFHRHERRRKPWRHRMQEGWERMTPEEREKFCEGIAGIWGPARTEPSKSE